MGAKTEKKRMREIRCVSRTTGVQFLSLSLSLSPDSLRCVADCRAYSSLVVLCVSLTHECRQQWIAFFLVCYPVLVPVPVPVPDERRPGNAFPCAST